MAYGTVDFLYDATPRYTTLEAVKAAMEINDTVNDTEITQAINAAELQVDVFNCRSFPDLPLVEPIHGDEIDGIPVPIRVWALSASIGTYKLRDQVFGAAGSDEWIGSVDVADQVRRALQRNPMALGYKVLWGVA